MAVDTTRILSKSELQTVLGELIRKARRSPNTRINLIVFRLATCCGLRASEIAGLRLDDLRLGDRPTLRVRGAIAKRGKARVVPLTWDRATLDCLTAWKASRLAAGAEPSDPVICTRTGRPFIIQGIRDRYRTACKALGEERLQDITTHVGRHTFVSHALAGGRTLAEVQRAAGHSSIATTSIYTHVAVEDDGTIGDLFAVR